MITYSGTLNKRVDFGTLQELQNLQLKTIISVVSLTGATGEIFGFSPTSSTDEEFGMVLPAAGGGTNKLFFYVDWSGAQGQWYSNDSISTGIRHLAITYNNSDAANDPLMYIDGQSAAITELAAPSGSYTSGLVNSVRVGSVLGPSVNGSIITLLVYNRILSAAEIADAYNSRLAIPNYNGLVFAPNLNGAAGLQTFDGATLSGTNYLRDTISGATGTPSGSPVGAADTYLNWK